jgi:threonine synthase
VAKKAPAKKVVAKKVPPKKAPAAKAKAPAKKVEAPKKSAATKVPAKPVVPAPVVHVTPIIPGYTPVVHKKNSRAAKMAALVPPPPTQVLASTAAKNSFMPISNQAATTIIPVIPKKDAKLVNNWKTKTADQLTDAEVIEAFQLLSRTEGIIPALEPAHALAWVIRDRAKLAGKTVLLNMSGRGDKDVAQMMEILG